MCMILCKCMSRFSDMDKYAFTSTWTYVVTELLRFLSAVDSLIDLEFEANTFLI